MSKTILVANQKGGVSKSTVATNLAVYFASQGVDTLLLDADPQCTAANFIARRNEAGLLPEVHCAQKTGNILKTAQEMAKRFELTIIDVGGRDSEELRSGLMAADLVLVPTRASQADLERMPMMDELIRMAQAMRPDLLARAIITMAPTNPVITEVQDAREMLAEFETLELLPYLVRDRKVYRDALLDGRSVIETTNGQAKAEIQLLGQAIADLLNMGDK